METQAWGKSQTRAKQEGAILGDSLNVLIVVERLKPTKKTGYNCENRGKSYFVSRNRVLLSPEDVNAWIEINRTRRNARTAKLPVEERRVCDAATHRKAMRIRYRAAGMAKGGWIGAGRDIARGQTGMDKVDIGSNFLSYTQKHAHFGSAVKPVDGWKPTASITNSVAHTASSHVLSKQGSAKAINFGLKKSVKFYQSALRAIDKKQKP